MSNKEEILNKLLKNLLDQRLKRLEKRNAEQLKDIKLEKDSYNKQGLLLKKLCSVKIEPKKTLKKSLTNEKLFGRGRDKTPNPNMRTRIKNQTNILDKKLIRSKTPEMIIPKKRPEPKEKINKIKKSKTPLKITRKLEKSKMPSYMAGTSSNMNKNRKSNDKSNLKKIKIKTPDTKTKTKEIKKKITFNQNKENKENNIDNEITNLKLIDIKIEDMKEYIITEEKKPEIKEEKKECKFDLVIDNNKIMNTIIPFLDEISQYNLLSCNKKIIKFLYEKLMTSIDSIKTQNNINGSSTIQDQINSLKLKYKNEELYAEPPKFDLSKSTIKAIELLNGDTYNKIFTTKELKPPLNEILLIYRLFFQFFKVNNIHNTSDDKLFWLEVCEYILNNNNNKTGELFKEAINSFDFSIRNIYEVKKMIYGKEDKIKPSAYSKICGTTGLILFLIKDTLEYCGVIHNIKKNVPCLLLKYLEFIREMENRVENYINILKKLNNN